MFYTRCFTQGGDSGGKKRKHSPSAPTTERHRTKSATTGLDNGISTNSSAELSHCAKTAASLPMNVTNVGGGAAAAEQVSVESLSFDEGEIAGSLVGLDEVADGRLIIDTTVDSSLPAAEAKTTTVKPQSFVKRTDYINWEEMFMGVAILAAKRSKDPSTQVGAVIVNEDHVIIGIGYNGMPVGISDDEFPWGKGSDNPLDNKYAYVCHAEMNAILNKNTANVKGATIFTTYFPCNECAKLIIQSRISRIIYLKDKPNKAEMVASKRMLDAVGVQYSQFSSSRPDLLITFSTSS